MGATCTGACIDQSRATNRFDINLGKMVSHKAH